jgi:putative glutamine amidotransferase
MRIAITQRVEQVPVYGERRDCLDQRWSLLMESLDVDLVPVPNGLKNPKDWLLRQNVAGLILSGGNDLSHLPDAQNCSPERDFTEISLLLHAQKVLLPVLGVCRGMQMLNHFLGGTLTTLDGHAGGLHSIHSLSPSALFSTYLQVNSFHGWGIERSNLAENLQVHVEANDGSIEAFIHNQLPWMGIMWHPERPSSNLEADGQLIRHLFFKQGLL